MILIATPASARTFSWHTPKWEPLNADVCVTSPLDSLSGRAYVVEERAWVTNLTIGRPAYGVRQEFWSAKKWVWAPWLPYLDGKPHTVTTPKKYCATGDSCKLEIKSKNLDKNGNGQWGCWTTYFWRER